MPDKSVPEINIYAKFEKTQGEREFFGCGGALE